MYFPVGGIVSLLYVTNAGASAKLAVIGCEGMIGIALFMGGDSVQSVCDAYRLDAAGLKGEFARGGAVRLQLLLYAQALITQISQTAVCNRHHDRLPANELKMTQELIANMLGVRRQGVTKAAGALEKRGFISYRRGTIVALDRAGIEACACECYGMVRREYDRLRALSPARAG